MKASLRCLVIGASIVCSCARAGQAAQQSELNALVSAGISAFDSGRHAEAEQRFSSALALLEESAVSDESLARVLCRLAAVYQATGRADHGQRLLMRAVRILESRPRPDPAELAVVWQGVGVGHLASRSYTRAAESFQKALEFKTTAEGRDDLETIPILCGIAAAYKAANRLVEAEAALRRAEKVLDPDSDESMRAFLLTNLGILYGGQGRLVESYALLRRAESVAASVRGAATLAPIQPLLPHLWSHLGKICFKRKQYAEAEMWFARAVDLVDAGAAISPALTAQILNGYATCLRQAGKKKHAKSREQSAKAILRQTPRQETPDLLIDIHALIRPN